MYFSFQNCVSVCSFKHWNLIEFIKKKISRNDRPVLGNLAQYSDSVTTPEELLDLCCQYPACYDPLYELCIDTCRFINHSVTVFLRDSPGMADSQRVSYKTLSVDSVWITYPCFLFLFLPHYYVWSIWSTMK